MLIIAITVINFFVNGVPILTAVVRNIISLFKRCRAKWRAWASAKEKLARLRYRTPEEQEYGRRVERRAKVSSNNLTTFAGLE